MVQSCACAGLLVPCPQLHARPQGTAWVWACTWVSVTHERRAASLLLPGGLLPAEGAPFSPSVVWGDSVVTGVFAGETRGTSTGG